jgi:hypothetical protein
MVIAAETAIQAGHRVEGLNALKFVIGTTRLDARLLYQLGHAQYVLGDYQQAEVALRQSLAIEPRNAPALNDLAVTLFAMGRDVEGLSFIAQALAIDPNQPEAAETDSIWLLRLGRFRDGWRQYEARLRTDAARPYLRNFPQPQWRGEPIEGRTILLHAEQGMGDTIQFARYAPLVAARGARVVLEVQAGLRAILGGLAGIDRVLERGEPLPRFDLHCPLPSLPGVLDTDLDSIPLPIPYVAVPPDRVALWRQRLGPRRGIRIGIAWSGNPHHRDDARRSIPLARFGRLLADRTGCAFHVLQTTMRAPDRETLAAMPHLRDHGRHLTDFGDTAALVRLMDLVISVDTSLAHLAGAMDRPAWVLLTAVPDWRWMLGRDDSPWYPSLTLFRQPCRDDWDSVLTEVAQRLDTVLT